MKGVQCYELFGGIALKNHTFSFFFSICHTQDGLTYLQYCSSDNHINVFFTHLFLFSLVLSANVYLLDVLCFC